MKLADIAESVRIDPRKLTHYVLDTDSPHGKHKAVLFDKLLGFTKENHTGLLRQLEGGAMQAEVTFHSEDKFGKTLYGRHYRQRNKRPALCRKNRMDRNSRNQGSSSRNTLCKEKNMMPDIGDIIELIIDIPEKNLRAGVRGAVVHCHGNDAYEIEFTDDEGETLDFSALHAKHFIVVWRAETRQWIPIAEQASALVAGLPDDAAKEVLDFARFLSVRSCHSVSHENISA